MDSIITTPEDERLANMLQALGNPMRLAIMRYVAGNPGCICNDLVVRFDRAQATVSQHLAMLRNANILIAEKDGHATCYRLDLESVAWLEAQLRQLTGMTESATQRHIG